MQDELFFCFSAVVVIGFLLGMVGALIGKDVKVPIPLFHIFGWSFKNTYFWTPALMYQVYFWADLAGIFNK